MKFKKFIIPALCMAMLSAGCSGQDPVTPGNEAQISIDSNSKPDYREKLEEELKALRESEMWQTAVTVRKLRPENN